MGNFNQNVAYIKDARRMLASIETMSTVDVDET